MPYKFEDFQENIPKRGRKYNKDSDNKIMNQLTLSKIFVQISIW